MEEEGISLSEAYAHAVSQFRSLRAEHEMATATAYREAEFYGADFGPTEIQNTFDREQRFVDSWDSGSRTKRRSSEVDNRWRAILPKRGKKGSWTGGQEYVQLWKEGVRPSFARVLNVPRIAAAAGTPSTAPAKQSFSTDDFMNLQSQMATINVKNPTP